MHFSSLMVHQLYELWSVSTFKIKLYYLNDRKFKWYNFGSLQKPKVNLLILKIQSELHMIFQRNTQNYIVYSHFIFSFEYSLGD